MAAVAPARTMFSHTPLDENVELEEDLLADLPAEEPEEQSEPEEFPESDASTSLSGSNDTESEREQTSSSSSARSEDDTSSSSLSTTTPSQSHTSTLATTSRPIEDLFEQRPPSPSSSEPPGLVLSLNSNDYILFSLPNSTSSVNSDVNSGVLFSDKPFLFKAPLQSLMSELQTYFSLENDVTLEFPDLQLSFSTHMIYTQKVTLAHVHLLTQALDRNLPFRATLTEQPNAFLKQYNRLILLAQTGKGAEFRPLSPSASSSDLPVPGSSSPQSVGVEPSEPAQKPFESSEEEAEFSEQVHVPVPNETIDFEATYNLDPNIEEDAGAEDEIEEEAIEEVRELSETVNGIDSTVAEEALQEDPTVVSDELEVEIGDINSDLPPPTDTEPTPALPLKPHSRAFEPDQDDEDAELARKRPRLSPPPEEFDDDAVFAEDL